MKRKILITTLMAGVVVTETTWARFDTDIADDDQPITEQNSVSVRDPSSITCTQSWEVCQYDTQNRLIYYLTDNRVQNSDHTDYHYTYDNATGILIEYASTHAHSEMEDGYVEYAEKVKFDPISGNKTEQLINDMNNNIYYKYDPTSGNITEEYRYRHDDYAEYDSEKGNVVEPYNVNAEYKKYDSATGMVLEGGYIEFNIGGENNLPSVIESTPKWVYTYETNDKGELAQLKSPGTDFDDYDRSLSLTVFNSDGSVKSHNTIYYGEDDNVFYTDDYQEFRWSEETQTYNGQLCVTEYFGDPDDPEGREVCSDVSYSSPMNMLKGITTADEEREQKKSETKRRIYTVEEAAAVVKPMKNTFRIRYK